MKKAVFAGCLAVMMLLSMTLLLLRPVPAEAVQQTAGRNTAEDSGQAAETAAAAPSGAEAAAWAQDAPAADASFDEATAVCVLCGDQPTAMSLEDYLTGVVLAEMPASFEPAALEAQAVAARTFVLKQRLAPKHDNADVCAQGSCCQAYLTEAEAAEKLGTDAASYVEKVRTAVHATDGLVIEYEGELIEAVYFSNSGGATEAAVAVWGGEVPYLQSVESPGEEESSRYADSVVVPFAEFRRTVLAEAPEADLTGQPAEWFGGETRTEGGGVETLEIGGVAFSGTALRSLFGLRSTNFTVGVQRDGIVFDTLGNGHRVGMSQYGAQAMAENGADFREILTHYYSGVEIVPAEA